jgi:hypothetical protein
MEVCSAGLVLSPLVAVDPDLGSDRPRGSDLDSHLGEGRPEVGVPDVNDG